MEKKEKKFLEFVENFDLFKFENDYLWNLAFYKLNAIYKICHSYEYDYLISLDCDVYVQNSLENIFEEIEQNILKIAKNLKDQIFINEDEYGLLNSPEIYFIPGSLGVFFAKDKRFRQYFDDVFYLNEEIQKIDGIIQSEKKNREETQEGILEMIKIMNDRMKNDLANERKEREQNEEVLIDVLENTCNGLQQTTSKI